MRRSSPRRGYALMTIGTAASLVWLAGLAAQESQDRYRFRTGIELINVTATVTDASGRFVRGLTQADFRVYEDDQPIEVTHFSAERVPVSLGIVVDTSASMTGQKIEAARHALDHFLFDLLGPEDEVFLYRFDTRPHLVEGWTTDRNRIREQLARIRPDGATALYDAVAEALPLLDSGRHRKKALLVISDGIDTNSVTDLHSVKQLIHQSEALVYAIGLGEQTTITPLNQKNRRDESIRYQRRRPIPMPIPMPGPRMPPRNPPVPGAPPPGSSWPPKTPDEEPDDAKIRSDRDRVDLAVLREITDDSGGRTELLRQSGDLDSATSRIADELSRQYYLGYPSHGYRDGRWHTIRVEVRDPSLRVRARRGYMAAVD
jgi:VWFA-related protein